jgi:hypothetical protein
LEASGISVARALLVKLHTAGAGRLLESAFLFGLATILAAGGWFATIDHVARSQALPDSAAATRDAWTDQPRVTCS